MPTPRFSDASATGDLLTELSRIQNSGIAVLHRNPYLHVVFTDYLDGSNFDLFVTEANVIEIHPGFRASVGAIARLADRLAERFAAVSTVESGVADTVTLDDLTVAL
ncbi:hypothetical protein GCM10010199_18630 [Dactylosporangium roseum]